MSFHTRCLATFLKFIHLNELLDPRINPVKAALNFK